MGRRGRKGVGEGGVGKGEGQTTHPPTNQPAKTSPTILVRGTKGVRCKCGVGYYKVVGGVVARVG